MKNPSDLLNTATWDGLTLYLDNRGKLRAKGPTEVLDAWRPVILEANDALVDYLTPKRLWLIHQEATGWASHAFTPPASEAEVSGWYPDATILDEEAEAAL
ncbi:MAG: hypothetical protein IT487_20675 [Chromatiaceae bacterium]|nr:hypothetical protein [Chromatiaceae bacterium]